MDISSKLVKSAIALGTGLFLGYGLYKSASSLKRSKRKIRLPRKSDNERDTKLLPKNTAIQFSNSKPVSKRFKRNLTKRKIDMNISSLKSPKRQNIRIDPEKRRKLADAFGTAQDPNISKFFDSV